MIASVGTFSGLFGAVLVPILQGAQMWTRYVNAKGGVNGHPVRMIVYDDGGDPARHRAQVQEAVERRHVIAFMPMLAAATGQSSVDYITAKRIPVIVADEITPGVYDSPMYFSQAPHGKYVLHQALPSAFQQLRPKGKTKLGTVTCVELALCHDTDRIWRDTAKEEGWDLVYQVKAAVSQPDYTAECLSARNAGAQVMLMGWDPASTERFALSCARQGFRPTFTSVTGGIADRFKENTNFEGFVGSFPVFPYFGSGTPAIDEFHKAMKTYGTGIGAGISAVLGWVAGKLFEKAVANLPEPPTSEAVLVGLWSIKDDTLGGLTQPLTFIKDRPQEPLECWFNVVIEDGAWVSPDGYEQHCRAVSRRF